MSVLVSRLKTFKPVELGSLAFYALTGLLLLVFLPFTGFPPHVGFLGIFSLITAYSLLMRRAWAPWFVAFLLVVNTVFSLDILLTIGFTNVLVALSMIGYVIFTWFFALTIILKD